MRLPLLSSRQTVPEPVGASIDSLRERAQGVAVDAVEALGPRLDAARETIAPRLAEAAEKTSQLASQLADEARDVALPKIEAAREQALTTVKRRVLPRLTKTIAEAEAVSKPARREAKKRSEAAIAALRGDVPSRRRRWPRAVMLMGAGAVAGAAAGLMAGRKESASPGLDAYSPLGGSDPYARTEPTTTGLTGAASPSTPNPTPSTPNPTPSASAGSRSAAPTTGTTPATADTTIDVTEPAAVTGEGDAAKAKPAGARKPRTQS